MPSKLKLILKMKSKTSKNQKASFASSAAQTHMDSRDQDENDKTIFFDLAMKSPLKGSSKSALEGSSSTLDTVASPEPDSPFGCDVRVLDEEFPPVPLMQQIEEEEGALSPYKDELPRKSCLRQPGSAPRSVSKERRGRTIDLFVLGQPNLVRRKNCIVFDEIVRVKNVTPIRELVEDHLSLYYQVSDYEAIKLKAKKLIYKVENNLTNGKNYCIRGLEGYLNYQARQLSKLDGWDAVLEEQDLQSQHGVFCDERIAEAYIESTIRSKREAEQRAEMDALDVRFYMGLDR
jgi:hypothetical protein